MERVRIEPQTGYGLELKQGQILRVIDPEGEQVSDVIAFAAGDKAEKLSSGRSIDYNDTIYLTTGHVLYSNRSRPMFTILAVAALTPGLAYCGSIRMSRPFSSSVITYR